MHVKGFFGEIKYAMAQIYPSNVSSNGHAIIIKGRERGGENLYKICIFIYPRKATTTVIVAKCIWSGMTSSYFRGNAMNIPYCNIATWSRDFVP